MSVFWAEIVGTMILILLGGGVVANFMLNKSKGQSSAYSKCGGIMKKYFLLFLLVSLSLTVIMSGCLKTVVPTVPSEVPTDQSEEMNNIDKFGPSSPQLFATPSQVQPGGILTVEFSGAPGNLKDFVAMYRTGVGDKEGYVTYQWLQGKTAGTLTFIAPSTAGTYEFRMFLNNTWEKLVTSNTITVGSVISLTVSPTSVSPGQTIIVTFSGAPGNLKDFVAMYRTGVGDKEGYVTYQWLQGKTTGTLTFTAPSTAGTYEFRMFRNNTWFKLGTSNVVTVGQGANLKASPNSVVAGDQLTVTFSGAPGNLKDFVALYRTGVGDKEGYVTYQWLQGKTTGTLTFTAPSTAGTYEFRMFRNNTWFKLGTSNVVTVIPLSLTVSPASVSSGQSITVTFSGAPGNLKDFVAMYHTGVGDKEGYVTYQWLQGNTTGTLTFTAPSTAGTYEFRMFLNNTWKKLATSNSVTVAGSMITLEASPTTISQGDTISVYYSGAPGNSYDWVGMFEIGAENSKFIYRQFLWGTTSDTLLFTAPQNIASTYEFRLFRNNTYEKLATSNPVTVAGLPTINTSPTVVRPGDTIIVTYSNAPTSSLQGDGIVWMDLYSLDRAIWYWKDYEQITQSNGTFYFTAPDDPGKYIFRIMVNGYWYYATSNTFEVKVDGIATIAASPTQVSPGQTIQVDFSGAPGNPKDFIALYKTGVSDKGGYETYQWLNSQTSGTLTFTAPLTTGFYEFRLFQNNTWTKLGTSNTVVVSTFDPDTLDLMRIMHWGGNRVVRWRDGDIGVYNGTSFQDLQNTVLNVWNNVIEGPVRFLESTSTNSPVKILLDYDLVGTNIAGYSDTSWRNYEIYKSEICINPEAFENYPWYLRHIYLHEYGHTIGLAHVSDGGLMDYSSGYDMDEIKDPLKNVVYTLYRQPIGNQLAIALSSEEDLPSEGQIHFEYPLE